MYGSGTGSLSVLRFDGSQVIEIWRQAGNLIIETFQVINQSQSSEN